MHRIAPVVSVMLIAFLTSQGALAGEIVPPTGISHGEIFQYSQATGERLNDVVAGGVVSDGLDVLLPVLVIVFLVGMLGLAH